MIINYTAIKDPEFKGTWERYNKIASSNIDEHLRDIKKVIMKDKPDDKNEVIFYSIPDRRGMRFIQIRENLESDKFKFIIISDFRYEWK